MKLYVILDRIGGINGSGVYFHRIKELTKVRAEYEKVSRRMYTSTINRVYSDLVDDRFYLAREAAWKEVHDYLYNHNESIEINDIEDFNIYGYKYIYGFRKKYGIFAPLAQAEGQDQDFFTNWIKSEVLRTISNEYYEITWDTSKMFMKCVNGAILEDFLEALPKQDAFKKSILHPYYPGVYYSFIMPEAALLELKEGKIISLHWESIDLTDYIPAKEEALK